MWRIILIQVSIFQCLMSQDSQLIDVFLFCVVARSFDVSIKESVNELKTDLLKVCATHGNESHVSELMN